MPLTSEQEFIHLIQQHAGIIHKIINLYVDNMEDKEDLHQEILLQAWKSFGNFQGKSAFSTWLYKVSLNTALSFNKKVKKHAELLPNDQLVTKSEEGQPEVADRLYQLVCQLNEIDKMIMTLHLEGYKNPEIAEITGLKINHINVKLHRLKNQIIEQLKQK